MKMGRTQYISKGINSQTLIKGDKGYTFLINSWRKIKGNSALFTTTKDEARENKMLTISTHLE